MYTWISCRILDHILYAGQEAVQYNREPKRLATRAHLLLKLDSCFPSPLRYQWQMANNDSGAKNGFPGHSRLIHLICHPVRLLIEIRSWIISHDLILISETSTFWGVIRRFHRHNISINLTFTSSETTRFVRQGPDDSINVLRDRVSYHTKRVK